LAGAIVPPVEHGMIQFE